MREGRKVQGEQGRGINKRWHQSCTRLQHVSPMDQLQRLTISFRAVRYVQNPTVNKKFPPQSQVTSHTQSPPQVSNTQQNVMWDNDYRDLLYNSVIVFILKKHLIFQGWWLFCRDTPFSSLRCHRTSFTTQTIVTYKRHDTLFMSESQHSAPQEGIWTVRERF